MDFFDAEIQIPLYATFRFLPLPQSLPAQIGCSPAGTVPDA